MRTLHTRVRRARAGERGVALLLAMLLLVVLIAITIQISVTTGTDARIARNDMTLASMDLAVESALLQVEEALKADGESAGEEGAGAAGAPAAPGASGAPAAAPGGAPGAAESEAHDSQRDEWHQPQRTEINDIRLRIFVQDEDSKFNVLNLLNPDEGEAKLAAERLVRILDWCREGSREYDIDTRMAEAMVKTMLEHMQRRGDSKIPRPKLLTDVDGQDGGLPLSLEEFMALPPFEEHHFRDLRDRDGEVVHSIGSFLTVWTSLGVAGDLPQTGKSGSAAGAAGAGVSAGSTGGTGSQSSGKGGSTAQDGASTAGGSQGSAGAAGTGGQGAAGQGGAGAAGAAGSSGAATSGGYAVNVNTAPAAVLKGLFDDRDIHPRLFDRILEYRNLEEEEEESDTNEDEIDEEDIQLDEYGQEKIERRIFESLAELSEVDGFTDLPTEQQNRLNQILTTKSNVFSIYVVARRSTSVQGDMDGGLDPNELRKREESAGDSLVRVVRSVVWRRTIDEEIVLVPLVRWEIIDYLPFEVLDFPPEDR